MSLREFLRTARLYWKTFAAAALAVLALGAAWLILTPLQYVSTAQLLVSLNGTSTANAYQNDDVVAARVNSYVALMTSDVVGQRVIDKLGLGMTPRELAAKVSAVQVPPNTAIIDIAATDPSPDRARQIADTVATEFVSYTKALETPTGADAQKVQTSIVSTASQPRSRLPELVALAGLVGVLALLSGAFAVWIRAITDRVVRTPRQAADAADAPVFGVEDSRPAESLAALEPYRQLRAVLDQHAGAVVQISGVDHGVAAADLAANLGRAIMLSGDTCVVLDATGGRSDGDATGGRSDGDATGGRSDGDATGGRSDGESEAQSPEAGSPDVRVAGEWAADPESAVGPSVQAVIGPLARDYRHVVVATPDLLSSATASALSDCTDAVVLVVDLGTTTKTHVVQAVKSLRGLGANVAGVLALGATG